MHSIFANTVDIYTLYIHTFTICILQPNRPNYQSWSRSRSQANDKWHDVICAKSLIDTHESCCGSSSGEVPRPPSPCSVQPSSPPQIFIEGDSICSLIPCKARTRPDRGNLQHEAGRSIYRVCVSRAVGRRGVGTALFVPQFASFLLPLRLRRSQKWPNALMKLILITMTMTMWGRRQWGLQNRSSGLGGSNGGGWVLCASVCKRKILLQSEGSLCCLSAQGRVNGSRRRRGVA